MILCRRRNTYTKSVFSGLTLPDPILVLGPRIGSLSAKILTARLRRTRDELDVTSRAGIVYNINVSGRSHVGVIQFARPVTAHTSARESDRQSTLRVFLERLVSNQPHW